MRRLRKMFNLMILCAGFSLGALGCTSNNNNQENSREKKETMATKNNEVKVTTEVSTVPTEEVLEEPTVIPEEEFDTVADYYQFEDSDENTLAALIYLGYGDEEKEEKLQSLMEQFGLTEDLFEEAVIHKNCEWYAVFPKYIGTTVKVDSVVLSEEGELVPDEEKIETDKPILICCNVSDIVPSSQVTVSYKEQQIQWNPFLSLEDGNVAKEDKVYTAKWE